jgi:hypothetical protein
LEGGAGIWDAYVRWCRRRSCAACGSCAHHVLAHAAAVLDRVSSLYSSGTLAETCLATVNGLRSEDLGRVLPAGSCTMREAGCLQCLECMGSAGDIVQGAGAGSSIRPWAPFMYCAVSSGSSSRARYTQLEHQARHAGPYSCRYICRNSAVLVWGVCLHSALCCAVTWLLRHTALQHVRHTATVCFWLFSLCAALVGRLRGLV